MNYCTDLKTAQAGQVVIRHRGGVRFVRTIARTTATLIIIEEPHAEGGTYEVKHRRSDGYEPAASVYYGRPWIEPATEELVAQVRGENRKRSVRRWFMDQVFTDAELDAIKSTIDAMREQAAKPQKD